MKSVKGTAQAAQKERRRAEEKLRVVTRAREVMADCRRVLVRASDEMQLLQDMCRIVVGTGGYRAAWIGLVRHDGGKTIQPVASAGDEDEYLKSLRLSWSDDEFGQGPAGAAVRTRQPQVARRIRDDPYFSKLRNEALARGYRAAAAFPLVFESEVLGVIGVLAAEAEAFDAPEVGLLDGLASDIAYGLVNLRLRATRRRDEQLLKLEHLVVRRLADSESASEALTAVMRAVCETENWECGRYFRVDEAANVLRFAGCWHVPDPAVERFVDASRSIAFPRGTGLSGRAWESGEALWSTDIQNDPRALRAGLFAEFGMRGAFDFPVTAGGTTIGVLAFSSRQTREPDDRLLSAVHAIGSQIGQFLQRKHAEEVLRDSEARFRSLTRISSDWYWEQDAEYRFVDMTTEIDRKTGVSALAHIGKRRWELPAPNMSEADWTAHRAIVEAHQPFYDLDLCRHAEDGTVRWVSISGEPIVDAEGNFRGYRGIGRDITARRREENLLALEHAVTRRLADADTVEAGLKGVIRAICETEDWECGRFLKVDEAAGVLRFSESWSKPGAAVGRFIESKREATVAPGVGLAGCAWQSGEPAWVSDISQDDRSLRAALTLATGMLGAFHFPVRFGEKTMGVLAFNSHKVRDPDPRLLQAVRVVGSQIGQFLQRKETEDRLTHLAEFDTITGLPNRYLFRDRLDQTLNQAQRNQWLVGVLFIDLDRFKAVNDTYGHGVGDKLLGQTAARIKQCVRGGDTVGRLSGDEFAVALSNLAQADDAGLVAQKIVQNLAAAFELDGIQTYVTASIGIALYPDDGADADALLKNADTAMYRAKEQGRNNYQFYLPQMNERLMQRLQLEAQLRGALKRAEFLLHYQPKVSLVTGAITGFEALLRWRPGELMVSPAEFIPILEETGLIVPVGEWVLSTVCGQIRQWQRDGLSVRPVAVNLSARQFQRKNLADTVAQTLRETGVDPGLLELELTETLLMGDAEEAVQMLHRLKALGVGLAVDDFGTGYSSLAYLKRFPLDALKIDRAFIRDAFSDPDDAAITLTIVNLAHSLKLKVVAEGVETAEQLQFLRSNGCDEMQGFYFARPLPPEECARALAEDRRLENVRNQVTANPPVLLLLDDNRNDLALLESALAPEGFRILTAASPGAALDVLAGDSVDIVISDHYMPEMTGVEFLSKVKTLYPNTVRVLASGDDNRRTLMEAINSAGIHKFLVKNWDPDRLRAEVREAYEQRR